MILFLKEKNVDGTFRFTEKSKDLADYYGLFYYSEL